MSANLNLAYGALLAMLVVPQYVLIHPYLHLLITAPLLVWIGCQRALIESQKAPGESQMETVTKKDAMQFPLIGSAVLFGLYIVVKFVSKEHLDILISIYFAGIGALGVFSTVRTPVSQLLSAEKLKVLSVRFHWKFWKRKREDDDAFALDFNALDVVLLVASTGLSLSYAYFKTWYLNNCLGFAFSIQGIEMISLGSYVIGCILLAGLFVYDVFWVFGTEVMVAVAKGINAPIKIMFPKALGVKPLPCSMLGLGDIVVPGIFVALMLRFDAKLLLSSQPYFTTNFVAYVLGLVVTVGVMHFFDAAQPALLYLVPACIGASLLTAASRGELKELLNYSVEKRPTETSEAAAAESTVAAESRTDQ
jgi:minor histocompatibility antigen H13